MIHSKLNKKGDSYEIPTLRQQRTLLAAAEDGTILAGQWGPLRQYSVAVERGPKDPLKFSERFSLTQGPTSGIIRATSDDSHSSKIVAQLP